MSYRWITATAIIAVGLIVGCVTYFCFHRPMPDAEAHSHDSLMWVRQEFKISGDKLARVEKMHEDYELVCADHCQAIADARNELKRLRAANAPQAAITAAEAKAASIDSLCVTSTQTHIKEVAAVIGGEEGRRYLSIVLPRVASFDHAAPATLDMQKSPPSIRRLSMTTTSLWPRQKRQDSRYGMLLNFLIESGWSYLMRRI